LAASGLLGCLGASPTPRFYALQPIAMESAVSRDLAIAVGPLHLPRYLQNPRIVTRLGQSQIEYEELHRWAGDLESEMLRVIAENLSRLVGSDRVVGYPLDGPFSMTYRVRLDVERFDGRRGEAVEMRVRWVVVEAAGGEVLAVQLSNLRLPLGSESVPDLVEAHSKILEDLSRQIADRIAELQAGL
jgi:uncharacterized lipoprotein YmbA